MKNKRGFSVDCESLEELLDAIGNLPNTIDSIQIQSSLSHFQPPSIKLEYSNDLVYESRKILLETLKDVKYGEQIDKFKLCSYYGYGSATDPYYVSLSSSSSRKFANDMSSGKYGSLD